MDILNIQTYGPFYKYSTVTFNIQPSVGNLDIKSTPISAEVYLDGSYKGSTPLTVSNVPVGTHTVVLKKSGYHEISKIVDVKYGQTTYVSETLILQTGSIKISSEPVGADVYFDEVYKGVTPITITSISVGTHTVVLKKFGYTDWTKSVDILVDRTVEINPSMVIFVFGSSDTLSSSDALPFFVIGLGAILVIGTLLLRRGRKSNQEVISPSNELKSVPLSLQAKEQPKKSSPEKLEEKSTIDVKTAFGYKGATILYKVKVENTSPAPIADIKVSLFVLNVFLLLEKEKSLVLLKPGESKTVTFDIRPTGECGDCEVSGKVAYYDTASNRTKENDMESKMLSIVCPMLKVKEISDSDWHNTVSNLLKTEESTKEIDMSADTLFNMASRIIKDMNMHMLKPEVTQDQKIFNGVARFYCEGIKGLHYAAQIEVVGGARKSKLILKAWAEKEDALTGFYHGVLDEIEKRVKVKEYIDDSIVQYNVHIGDKIGTLVKDSVVQRSNIGAGTRKCPDCGRGG